MEETTPTPKAKRLARTMIPKAKSSGPRKRQNRLLAEVETIDYKNVQLLKNFITDRGKLLPRRITGASGQEQRQLAQAIKRARILAMMPYSATGD